MFAHSLGRDSPSRRTSTPSPKGAPGQKQAFQELGVVLPLQRHPQSLGILAPGVLPLRRVPEGGCQMTAWARLSWFMPQAARCR